MTLAIGAILKERYRIDELLGQGGFGAVYRAWDLNLDEPAALKENFETSLAAQRQFQLEAKLLFKLRHTHLPRVHDFFVLPEKGMYLVMDYIEGEDLGTRLERHFTWMRQGKVIKTGQEVEYGITSLAREKASPKQVMQVRRKHWLIETGLNYRRDVTFREDATRMTKGAAGRILATIHNVVLALIKQAGFRNAAQARRWFDGHLDQAFALLVSGYSQL